MRYSEDTKTFLGCYLKRCCSCTKFKLLSQFSPRANRPGQFQPMCIPCQAAYSRRWQQDNPEKVSIKTAKYRDKNPAYFLAKNAKDKAMKLQRTPKWLNNLHYEQIKMFYAAAVSLSKEIGIKFDVDHIIPLKGANVSGLHVPWNLQVMTSSENRRKKNKF